MKHIASRLAAVRPSASMAASLAAKALMAEGVDVIDLSLGEPDFPTPPHIVDAAYEAAKRGETLYTAPAGTPALREAIARKFEHKNGLIFGLNQIAVANGASRSSSMRSWRQSMRATR
jgi:aspartate aminotransferase